MEKSIPWIGFQGRCRPWLGFFVEFLAKWLRKNWISYFKIVLFARLVWNIFGVFDYQLAEHRNFSAMIEEFLFHPLGGGKGGYLWKVWACSMYRAFGERKTIGFFERLRGKLCLVPSKAALASLTSSFCNYSLDLILLRCFQLWAWFCVCLRIFIFFSMKDQKENKNGLPSH